MLQKNCIYCNFQTRFTNLLLKHYEAEHSSDNGFNIMCGIDGCVKSYCKIPSLKKHIRNYHKKTCSSVPRESVDYSSTVPNEEVNVYYQVHQETRDERQLFPEVLTKNLTKFILKIREKNGVTEKTAAAIIDHFASTILEPCIAETSKKLESIPGLSNGEKEDILSPLNQLQTSHHHLDTVYKQRKHFEILGLVEPEERFISEGCRIVYIPILKTLRSLLKHNDVLSYVFVIR